MFRSPLSAVLILSEQTEREPVTSLELPTRFSPTGTGASAHEIPALGKLAHPMDFDRLSDEDLIARIRQGGSEADTLRDVLFRRYYSKVTFWCLRVCGSRQTAADLAQEVFLRVHERLHTFRLESRFSTWLYTVTRRTAINRGQAERRREAVSLDQETMPEPNDPSRDAEDMAASHEIGHELRRAMERDLEPLEAKVLYLHFVDGLTLPAITELLDLSNKSGAKAYIVNGKRKLERRFGRWLSRQSAD